MMILARSVENSLEKIMILAGSVENSLKKEVILAGSVENSQKKVVKRLGVLTMTALKYCVLRRSFSEKFDTMS